MVSEMIKNARLSSSGRKLLTSQQKAYLTVRRAVEEWDLSGLSCPEFCRRHGLVQASYINGVRMQNQEQL